MDRSTQGSAGNGGTFERERGPRGRDSGATGGPRRAQVVAWGGALALTLASCVGVPSPTWAGRRDAAPGDVRLTLPEAGGHDGERGTLHGACRPPRTGELVINEVALSPGGLDLDGDGASNGRDEMVELVSRADEPISLAGLSLFWRGERRGGVEASPCVPPRTSVVLLGQLGLEPSLPPGATLVRLDRTLRLTDSGGTLALHGLVDVRGEGSPPETPRVLAALTLPAAVTPAAPAVWARSRDGDWDAPLASHGALTERPWSPGRCVGGALFPCCLDWLDAEHEASRLHERVGRPQETTHDAAP